LLEGGAEALGGDALFGDMAATGAGEGLAGMGAASAAGGLGADYLSTLGGMDTLAGSQFASDMAPFTSSATDVASITGNAVPGLENNISSFEGVPESGGMPPTQEPIPGVNQGSNLTARGYMTPEGTIASSTIPSEGFAGQGLSTLANTSGSYSLANTAANGGLGMTGTQGIGTSLGYGSEGLGLGAPSEGMFAGAGPTAASTSPFSLQNMMNNPMGMVKSAYDTVSKNPIPSMYAAGSLYDMYAKNKMANAQTNMYNQNRADIMNTYAPGSPEYNLLAQQMARKDAAAGRNSQYGTRANDLAGTIAKLRMGALGNLQQGQNALGNQALSNQYGMFNTPLMLAAYSAKT
jgi:hypothetical protein